MWSEKDRKVFKYRDGSADESGELQYVFGDPFAIQRALTALLDGDPQKWLERRWEGIPEEGELDEEGNPKELVRSMEPVRYEATSKCIAAARIAFGLTPWDKRTGTGCGERHVLAVLDDFLEWLDNQKKTADSSPTSSAASPEPTGSPTTSPSGCGSM